MDDGVITTTNVSGFWKIDQNDTLGLFHLIGPANSYTHKLPIESGISMLS